MNEQLENKLEEPYLVVAGKIFSLVESTHPPELATRLSHYRREEPYEEGDNKFALVTGILNLPPKEDAVVGVFSHDYVLHVSHPSKVVPLPRTVEALFSFTRQEKHLFLTVVEKKHLANFISDKLSGLLYGKVGQIVEAHIAPETLRNLRLKNPEDTEITFFDNADIPNVDKLSLYGPDLISTTLFEEYCKHGDL